MTTANRLNAQSRFSISLTRRLSWLSAPLLLYLLLTTYQLGLPGLHYDEAKEAGVNAVELLNGQPVAAFRNATLRLGDLQFPVMVQDYIGALNVYLALPFLHLTGIGVPNLRALSIVTGLLALILLERAMSEYICLSTPESDDPQTQLAITQSDTSQTHCAISNAGLITITLLAASPSFVFWITITLLAASPSFVFWSRQGIFVTNLTQPLCFACIWFGLRWLRQGRLWMLFLSTFCGGSALYAKLIVIWVIGPFFFLAAGWWLYQRYGHQSDHKRQLNAHVTPITLIGALFCFILPLTPLLIFNIQTSGTLLNIAQNLTHSYYSVDNRAVLQNLPIRWHHLWASIEGTHFWYLGTTAGNNLASFLTILALAVGLWANWRRMVLPLMFLGLTFTASLFTISDLFITHYALIQPVVISLVGLGASLGVSVVNTGRWFRRFSAMHLTLALVTVWLFLDLTASIQYHRALAQSGGLADHSDATYHLAYHLRYNGMGAPIVLDWGIDAPIRYLSHGTVRPIEIFGYSSLSEPDPQYTAHLAHFLENPDNVYLLHAPASTVFRGRREQFVVQIEELGLTPILERSFTQRDGTPLFELWRVGEEEAKAEEEKREKKGR
ncbi:hypothetical protein KFU94_57360 [Chloroflexi bacterium TSY]|nr:hypothetical protein [Chloroflexi bacterium TSY]